MSKNVSNEDLITKGNFRDYVVGRAQNSQVLRIHRVNSGLLILV